MPNEMDNAAIVELLRKKIAAGGEVDANVVVALAVFEAAPLLKEIANALTAIDSAIAPNREGQTIYDGLMRIAGTLEKLLDLIKHR